MTLRFTRQAFLLALVLAAPPASAQFLCAQPYDSGPVNCQVGSCGGSYSNYHCQGYGGGPLTCDCEFWENCCGVNYLRTPLTDCPGGCVCNLPAKDRKAASRTASTRPAKPVPIRGAGALLKAGTLSQGTDRREAVPVGSPTREATKDPGQ